VKPIGGRGIDELAWIVSTGNHRGADDVREVPDPEHIASGIDLDIDALSLVDGIDVDDHSLTSPVNIMMEACDTNPAVVGHRCRHAIELSAEKRGARGQVKGIVEENAVRDANSRRADPADFGVTVNNDRRVILGIVLQEDKVVAQSRAG
jgi:hypothetical protein